MSDLAPLTWKWEDHPEIELSDSCANGSCERCPGRFLDMDDGSRFDCGHPCHPSGSKGGGQ